MKGTACLPAIPRAALGAVLALGLAGVLAGCGDRSTLRAAQGTGPEPVLPAPRSSLLPTVAIAPALGWAAGAAPQPAPGLAVAAFAQGLEHPRWLHVLPNGDVLVAETNAPRPTGEAPGGLLRWLRGVAMRLVMARAGAAVPSADRITLLRDADGDGRAETRSVLLEGLHSPFGMALVGGWLYVANADGIVRVPYRDGDTRIDGTPEPVAALPGGLNHHWTKGLLASPDGRTLYATVGSNSNIGENGLALEEGRAAIWAVDLATGRTRVVASGLRNPVGMAWEPLTGALWTVVNERDELGNDLVPDYLTAVREGGFYGWPWSYWGGVVDSRVQPPRPDKVAQAIRPDYALGSHVAPLGLAHSAGAALPERFREGMFVGLHGSWNRRPPSGYGVVFVPFRDGRPAGPMADVLGGFLDAEGRAQGRPVGVALDRRGALLVADDVGNTVWRVTAATAAAAGGAPAAGTPR